MKSFFAIIVMAGLLGNIPFPAEAFIRGTKLEAQELVKRAVQHFEANGEVAFDDFTSSAEWKDRDLYIFVLDLQGVTVAHGFKKELIGINASSLKDVNGFAYISEIIATTDSNTVSYTWQNPVNAKMEKKESYVIRSGDFVFGAGYYAE